MKTVVIAKALLLDADGSMLLLHRSATHPNLAHAADLPGGQLEPDEEPGACLTREIEEEVGLRVPAATLRILYAGAEVTGDVSRVRILYAARLDSVQPQTTLSWEHEALQWEPLSSLADIETAFHSFYKDALHYVRTHSLLADV